MSTTSSLELAVLGLLKEGPMHGYELRKRLRFTLGPLYTVSYGSLYPCLKRLGTGRDGPGARCGDPKPRQAEGRGAQSGGRRAAARARHRPSAPARSTRSRPRARRSSSSSSSRAPSTTPTASRRASPSSATSRRRADPPPRAPQGVPRGEARRVQRDAARHARADGRVLAVADRPRRRDDADRTSGGCRD